MKFIKHKRYMDVCIQVLTEREFERSNDKFLLIQGWFWNLGQNTSFNIGQWANIEIELKDHRDWLEFETDNVSGCLRDVDWK